MNDSKPLPEPSGLAVGTGQGDMIVLGAGIAGLAAADSLSRAGHTVIVIEQTDRCGGTHRSCQIGRYTFDVGSIFYEEAARIFDLAPGLREIAPQVRRIQRRIAPTGQLVHYPMEPRDLLRWPRRKQVRALWDMVRSRLMTRRDGTLAAICLNRLGPTLFQGTGLKSYITRFHHASPTDLDEDFFFNRMGFIESATRPGALVRAALRALRRKPFHRGPPAMLRVRPVAGFDPMFRAIQTQLAAQGVRFALSEPLTAISRDANGFMISTANRTYSAAAVVNTVPLDTVYRAVFGTPSGLRSLDLLTLFVSAADLASAAGNVLFNFHGDGQWKRITVYSRLYPDHGTGREFFAAEVTQPPGHIPDPDVAFADLRDHLEGLGIAAGLILEGHTVVPDCYPLYVPGYNTALAARLAALREFGIVSVGRQGRFEYLPTSSGVIRRVIEELGAAPLPLPTPR